MARSQSLSLNFLLADTNGDIAYQAVGAFPVREHPKTSWILDGWTGEHEWLGLIPPEDKAWVINPKRGWIASANNRVSSRHTKYDLGSNIPALSARAIRIE